MIPINFPEANTQFGPPPDLEESQCQTIHAYLGKVQGQSCDGSDIVIVAWKPTAEELNILNLGGSIFLSCIGGLPPHFLSTSFQEAASPA